MNDTPTPRTDEWGTISKEDGHWSSHKRRERWIKTVPLKTSEELQTELTAVTEQRDEMTLRWELTNDSLFDKRALADRLETILKDCLYEMPCSYVPNHTVENLPLMIASQTSMFAEEITRGEKLEKQRDLLIEVLEVTLNATVLNHRKDRWHSDAEYALNKIKLNLKYE